MKWNSQLHNVIEMCTYNTKLEDFSVL